MTQWLVYKALNGLEPKYISDLLLYYKPPRSLRSPVTGFFSVLREKTKHGEVVIQFYVPHIGQNYQKTAGLFQFSVLLKYS